MDLSVTIITLNEEDNLARCLRSLPKGCEIIVVDSNSHDRTKEIAVSFGAQVFDRPFANFAEQKNEAISHATKTWVLSIDADEELTPELANDIGAVVSGSTSNEVLGYRILRQLHFMGQHMRWGKTADFPLRLVQRSAARFVGTVHEKIDISPDRIQRLHSPLIHYSYKDLSDYFRRFNRYTSLIAEQHSSKGKSFSFAFHLLRPWLEFFNRFVLRLGFLDGYPGYVYALNSSLYAFIKYSKLLEFKKK